MRKEAEFKCELQSLKERHRSLLFKIHLYLGFVQNSNFFRKIPSVIR
jgi:hypothetical protein